MDERDGLGDVAFLNFQVLIAYSLGRAFIALMWTLLIRWLTAIGGRL